MEQDVFVQGFRSLQEGRFAEAITAFQTVLEQRPDFAEAHNNWGNALQGQGKLDEAIAHYHQALQINSGYAEALNNLGNALLAKGNSEEAIRYYSQALQVSPDYAEAHAVLGLVFNAGEAVEGYTNFLWTALAAGAIALGRDPVLWSQLAGIACFAATLALLVAGGARLRGPAAPWLGIAAAGLALNTHGQVFATGGL